MTQSAVTQSTSSAFVDNPQQTATSVLFSFFERGTLLLAAMLGAFGWVMMTCRFFSDSSPLLDMASHTSWHVWLATSLVTAVSCVAFRSSTGEVRRRWWHRCLLATPPCLYFTWVTTPWVALPLADNDPSAAGLKIYSWNTWYLNQNTDEILDQVRSSDADVIALIELSNSQYDALQSLNDDYPFHLAHPEGSARGIGIWSRVPGTKLRAFDLADQGMMAIEADVPTSTVHNAYRVLAVHTRSPDFHQRTLDRNKQLVALGEWSKQSDTPSVIVGDLNITPWSPPFTRLLTAGRLSDSRHYRGHFGSWPSPLGSLSIPIDHALTTRGTQVVFRSVGDESGNSDHRPITVVVR